MGVTGSRQVQSFDHKTGWSPMQIVAQLPLDLELQRTV
jgi:hypothetical protein